MDYHMEFKYILIRHKLFFFGAYRDRSSTEVPLQNLCLWKVSFKQREEGDCYTGWVFRSCIAILIYVQIEYLKDNIMNI